MVLLSIYVPYIDPYLNQLVSIEVGMPTFIRNLPGHINFTKLSELVEEEVAHFQTPSYSSLQMVLQVSLSIILVKILARCLAKIFPRITCKEHVILHPSLDMTLHEKPCKLTWYDLTLS